MASRIFLFALLVPVGFGCARRDHVVHYPAPTTSASVYVEPSAAPTVYNSTVTYETYAETYEEVWIDDPTYGRVLEICPATVSEWDGYNIVQQVVVTPWGQDLQQNGQFVYNGSWLWVPGFNPLPHATVTFSTFHTLPRYQTYRRRHQPRRVIAPRIARARVRPRGYVRGASPTRAHGNVHTPHGNVHVRARPQVRIHSAAPTRAARPLVRRTPTPEPDVQPRRGHGRASIGVSRPASPSRVVVAPAPVQRTTPPRRIVRSAPPAGFQGRSTPSPSPRALPTPPSRSQSVHVRGRATHGQGHFARPVHNPGQVDLSSRRSSRSSDPRLKREPSRTIRSPRSSGSRGRSARPRRR